MRQLLGLILGLAALVAGFFFTWIIVAVFVAIALLLVITMLLRRLWFKLTGRQPAPFFVFRHHHHQAAYHPYREPPTADAGRVIDVTAEAADDDKKSLP